MRKFFGSVWTVIGTLLVSLIVTFKVTHLIVGHRDFSFWWIPALITLFVLVGEVARYRDRKQAHAKPDPLPDDPST